MPYCKLSLYIMYLIEFNFIQVQPYFFYFLISYSKLSIEVEIVVNYYSQIFSTFNNVYIFYSSRIDTILIVSTTTLPRGIKNKAFLLV